MDEETIAEYKALFCEFDKNGDNRMSSDELGTFVRCLGQNPTEKDLKEMLRELDSNGNGTIEFEELLKVMTEKGKTVDQETEELTEAFKKFDKDGNGKISAKELRAAMTEIGDSPFSKEDAQDMIKEADIDGDGYINYNEFVKIMTRK